MVHIICNIHQVTELCQRKFFREELTGTAAYLLNNRRLISANHREKPAGLN
jgi:hypothetical protein